MGEVLCINLDIDSVKVALVNKQLNLQEYQRFSTPETPNTLINNLVEYYNYFKNKYDIEGCSISCGIEELQLQQHQCDKLLEILQDKLNMPCVLNDEIHCISIAEQTYGALKDVDNATFMFLGSKLGGSIIVDGKLVEGRNHISGNFGKVLVRDKRGHLTTLEELISIKSMIKKIEAIDDGDWNDQRLFDEAKKGNDKCENIVRSFFIQFAIELLNIQHIIDPDIIVVGGVIKDQQGFINALDQAYNTIAKEVNITSKPKITFSTLNDRSNLIGAYIKYNDHS